MKKDTIKEIVLKIVEENKELFSDMELNLIKTNIKLTKKIYIMGLINGKNLQ